MSEERSFPLRPRSARALRVGDLIGVPLGDGWWACLQVTDLLAEGAGSASSLMVSPLAWRGSKPPTAEAVMGIPPTAQGMTHVALFVEGGLEVTGWSPVLVSPEGAGFGEFGVGARHQVWGWRAAIRRAQEAAAAVT